MSDAEVNLPPPPKVDGRSREAKERRRLAAERPMDDKPETVEASHTRPTRAQTVKRERRRREGVDKAGNLKLAFRFKPDPDFEYRWINHGIDGQRIKDLTVGDDWTMVTAEGEETDGLGTAMRRAVGESKSGPIYSYLCRKPKEWYEQDHAKRQERDDKMMAYIKEGRPPTAPEKALTTADHIYGEGVRMTSGIGRG